MSLLDLPHSVVRTIAGHRAKKTVTLMPITEEDTKPFRLPAKKRKPKEEKAALRNGCISFVELLGRPKPKKAPKKRKKKLTAEQTLAKRKQTRKAWIARPEVAEHQRKMNRARQRRFMERKKARDRMATGSPTTGSEGTS